MREHWYIWVPAILLIIAVLAGGWLYGRNALVVRAVLGEDEGMLGLWLAVGGNANAKDRSGAPVLALAVAVTEVKQPGAIPIVVDSDQSADKPIMELLLKHGARVDAQDAAGDTALHRAARTGRLDAATVLLDHGAKLEVFNHIGQTPLHCAARAGNPQAVQLLLDKGAKVDAGPPDWGTPLIDAAMRGDVETVRLLLEHDADPNAQGAIKTAWQSYDENGVYTGSGEKQGVVTPLILALYEPPAETQPAIVKLLLEHGADPAPQVEGGFADVVAKAAERQDEVGELLRYYRKHPVVRVRIGTY